MSKHMISDQNNINDINPFVLIDFSLPGSSATPYKFAPYVKGVEPDEPKEERSIACDMHTKVGGANFCAEQKGNCPMSRLVLPERVIQYEDGTVNTELCEDRKKVAEKKENGKRNLIIVLILIVLLYALMY